jgi:hypothetical protein
MRGLAVSATVTLAAGGVLLAPTAGAAAAATPGPGGFAAVYVAGDHTLGTVGADGVNHPTALHTCGGSSPAVATLASGATVTAFTNQNGFLETVGSDGTDHPTSLAVAGCTSPAITATSGGGTVIAYQAAGNTLATVGTDGASHPTTLHMDSGSSPAIAALPNGGTVIAYQNDTHAPATVGADGVAHAVAATMAAGSSPAITASNGNTTIAYKTSDGFLGTVAADGTVRKSTAFAVATSPAVTTLPGGTVTAFQGTDGFMYVVGTDGTTRSLFLGMAPGTTPALTPLNSTKAGFAFQANDGTLWQGTTDTLGHNTAAPTTQHPVAGTSPAIAPAVAPSLTSAQTNGTTVTVKWTDTSTNENTFTVNRAPLNEYPRAVGQVTSTTTAGTGTTYTFTDTIPAGTRPCYTITTANTILGTASLPSNSQCTATPNPLPTGLGIAQIVANNADSGGVLASTPVTVGSDGVGFMTFYDGSAKDLVAAHCDNIECTSVTTHTIDSAGDIGRDASVKIGSDGLPIISYDAATTATGTKIQDLKVAHCADVACSSATITTVDAASSVGGQPTALTIGGDGLATIAYVNINFGHSEIRAAHCLNLACTSSAINIIELLSQGDSGQVSITTSPAGRTYITALDGPDIGAANDGLLLYSCTNPACAPVASRTIIEPNTTFRVPSKSSVTIGSDGLPLITYLSFGNPDRIDVAHCLDVTCSQTKKSTVDSPVTDPTTAANMTAPSVTTGVDGLGIITYYDAINKNLKTAHCSNLDCSSSITADMPGLDEFGDVGSWTSITIGNDGLPLISYRDGTDHAVKTAHCGEVTCTQPLQAPFLTINK